MPLGDPVTLKVPNTGRQWRDFVSDPPGPAFRWIWGWCPDEVDPQGAGWGDLTLLVRTIGPANTWKSVVTGAAPSTLPTLWSRVEILNEPDTVDPNPPPPPPGPRKCWRPSWHSGAFPGVGNQNVGSSVIRWTVAPAGPVNSVPADPNNPGGGPYTWVLHDPYARWMLEALRPAAERRW